MVSALILVALIPREAIEENMLSSAKMLTEGERFGLAVEGLECSRIDRYADAILLNIAWSYDSEQPLRSVMLSSYYDVPLPEKCILFGELDLNGQVRPVSGQESRLTQARRLGFAPVVHPGKGGVRGIAEMAAMLFHRKAPS